jgi:thymidylate synthase (FAD)
MTLNQQQMLEIEEIRAKQQKTIRPVSPNLEEILYQPFQVLDKGFIRVVDYMGNDDAVVQAARVSYGAGTKKTSADKALINYLIAHRHTTPLEMCEIKFHIKLPIFVARQWIRHRTASVNEYSARYSVLEDEFYIPKAIHLASQSKINNQGRNEEQELGLEEQKEILKILKEDSQNCYQNYLKMINQDIDGNIINPNKEGLARELARMNLPVNCYTQWYWKIDLHNLLHFLHLRADKHSQYEIRAYAEIMLDIVKKWVPNCYEAFINNRKNGKEFSNNALETIKKIIKNQPVNQEESGLSKREWQELINILDIDL